jgi:hypothetical protein
MLVTVCLDGYSTSIRPGIREVLTNTLSRSDIVNSPIFSKKSSMFKLRSRKTRKFILEHNKSSNNLLLVGKSLGAKHLVERVINKLPPLKYRKIGLFLVDPNWPTLWDWTPNLNGRVLTVKTRVDYAINVYYLGKKREQAGARLCLNSDLPANNVALLDTDHQSIVNHFITRRKLYKMVLNLKT